MPKFIPALAFGLFLSGAFLFSTGHLSAAFFMEEHAKKEPVELFATLMAFDPGAGFGGDKVLTETFIKNGWSAIYSNKEYYSKYLENLKRNAERNIRLAKDLGFSTDREITSIFVWNVIEPEKGEYVWDATDTVIAAQNKAGVSLSAVIWPFAEWDQDSIPEDCKAFDFAYYNYKADTPTDWEAYKNFLTAAVERYDGDGINDMQGLMVPVKAWEVGNEFDGTCGGDLNEAKNLFELQKISYETIKAADPKAIVLNAGALELNSNKRDIRKFWEEFFELGGGEYLDVFNMHFNRAKGGATEKTTEDLEDAIIFFEDLMEENNAQKPIWMTEFGTYSGKPEPMKTPDGKTGPDSPEQTEDFQAAWYFKESVFAMSHSVEKIFIDFRGPDNSTIGGSALYNEKGEARPFIRTLQVIDKKLGNFENVEQLEEGQYLFTVDGEKIYVFWKGKIPSELTGKVKVTNMYGVEEQMKVSQIELSEDQPLFVE